MFEANFEKCCRQYSKRYMIRKKSDNTCVTPKIKHRIHEAGFVVSKTKKIQRLSKIFSAYFQRLFKDLSEQSAV